MCLDVEYLFLVDSSLFYRWLFRVSCDFGVPVRGGEPKVLLLRHLVLIKAVMLFYLESYIKHETSNGNIKISILVKTNKSTFSMKWRNRHHTCNVYAYFTYFKILEKKMSVVSFNSEKI